VAYVGVWLGAFLHNEKRGMSIEPAVLSLAFLISGCCLQPAGEPGDANSITDAGPDGGGYPRDPGPGPGDGGLTCQYYLYLLRYGICVDACAAACGCQDDPGKDQSSYDYPKCGPVYCYDGCEQRHSEDATDHDACVAHCDKITACWTQILDTARKKGC